MLSLTFLHKGEIYVYSEKQKGTEIIIARPATGEDYLFAEKSISETALGDVQLESVYYKNEFEISPNSTENIQILNKNESEIL